MQYIQRMTKTEAIQLLGGSPELAAHAIGVTGGAIRLWPEVLSPIQRDRVQAALYRKTETRRKPKTVAEPASETQGVA